MLNTFVVYVEKQARGVADPRRFRLFRRRAFQYLISLHRGTHGGSPRVFAEWTIRGGTRTAIKPCASESESLISSSNVFCSSKTSTSKARDFPPDLAMIKSFRQSTMRGVGTLLETRQIVFFRGAAAWVRFLAPEIADHLKINRWAKIKIDGFAGSAAAITALPGEMVRTGNSSPCARGG